MTKQHIRWAQQHDWFAKAVLTTKGYVVIVREGEAFEDFAQLRAYAGY